jgi:hypothetical protein
MDTVILTVPRSSCEMGDKTVKVDTGLTKDEFMMAVLAFMASNKKTMMVKRE